MAKERAMDTTSDPRRAAIEVVIARRAFQLVYQPIVHLDSGDVSGVEALCRFRDGRPPDRWFAEAEALGLAAELDLAIVETALADVGRLPGGYLSLNVSPSTLLEPGLLELVRGADVRAERLVIELTEHAPISNYGRARRTLDALRREGVHLAIDDAGAGYATFRHVLRLRPDIIKMDQSITQRLDEDPARMALATALVIFAGEIGAILIAEGVETAGEVAALRRAGVARAQGYVLGRPQALPLVEPAGGRVGSADVEQIDDERELCLPLSVGYDSSVAATAHALLSPVSGIDIALEL